MPLVARAETADGVRRGILAEVEAMRPDQLTRKPTPDSWNVLEVVEHLVLIEQVVLRGLPEFDQLVVRPRTLANRFWHAVIRAILFFNIPVKVPSRGMKPTGTRTLEELKALWDKQHAWVSRYAEHVDRTGRDPAVFKHPVAGPLTLRQSLRLVVPHMGRHWNQIRRLRASTS